MTTPGGPPANYPDLGSMRFGERRWGDALAHEFRVASDSVTNFGPKQLLSVQDCARVWALRISCTWTNFAENFVVEPLDDVQVGFTVSAGVGSGMVPHTYLFTLLALDGFAELFLPALPAQAIQVQVGLVFTAAAGEAPERPERFAFAASVAPYTRLRHDE